MQPDPKPADASAVVLVGGKSSRMGRPKALLPFDGEPLIAHVVRKLESLFSEIVVVAAPDQELPSLPVTIARDEVAYQGPVSGIYHALKNSAKEVCFVTSCDAPFLNLAFVSHLLAQISDVDVVVPFWEERFQPLHAVYRASVAPLLKNQLERGELRPIFLFDRVRTRKVSEAEIRRFDPEGMSMINMNSPEEYEAALRLWRAQSALSVSVELFGVPRMLAKTKSVSVDVVEGATLTQVLSALAEKLPMLTGRVIDAGELLPGYTCNINGLHFVRSSTAKVNSGDKIFILSADAGG